MNCDLYGLCCTPCLGGGRRLKHSVDERVSHFCVTKLRLEPVCPACDLELVEDLSGDNVDYSREISIRCLNPSCGYTGLAQPQFRCRGFDALTGQKCNARSIKESVTYLPQVAKIHDDIDDEMTLIYFNPCGCMVNLQEFPERMLDHLRNGENAWALPENSLVASPTCPMQVTELCSRSFIPREVYKLCGEEVRNLIQEHDTQAGRIRPNAAREDNNRANLRQNEPVLPPNPPLQVNVNENAQANRNRNNAQPRQEQNFVIPRRMRPDADLPGQ